MDQSNPSSPPLEIGSKNLEGAGVPVPPSHVVGEIQADLRQLKEDVARLNGDDVREQRRLRDARHSKVWVYATVLTLLLVLAFAAYLHNAGLIDLTPASVSVASTPSASSRGDFRDLLTVLVPIFALAIAFVVSAAGMKRLQSYDGEFAQARGERRIDFEKLREETRRDRAEIRDEIRSLIEKAEGDAKERHDAIRTDFAKTLSESEKRADGLKTELEKRLTEAQQKQGNTLTALVKAETKTAMQSIEEESKKSLSALLKTTTGKIQEEQDVVFRVRNDLTGLGKELGERFGFLIENGIKANLALGGPLTVGNIERQVSEHFRSRQPEKAVTLTRAALADPERLDGDANDWFNLSAELGRNDFYSEGLRVCQMALRKFSQAGQPINQDLLAHAIQYARTSGKWAEVADLREQAEGIGRDKWRWRLFVFVGDYLEDRDEAEFLKLNEDFARVHPGDERAFSQVAQYFQKAGRLAEAEQHIRQGLAKPNLRGEQLYSILSDILLEQKRYGEVIEATELGMACTATAHPSTSISALVFRRANALDSLFVMSLGDAAAVENGSCGQLGTRACRAYELYPRLDMTHPMMVLSAQRRLKIIRALAEERGILLLSSEPSGPEERPSAAATSAKISQYADGIVQMASDASVDDETWQNVTGQLVEKLTSDLGRGGVEMLVRKLRELAAMPDVKPLAQNRLRDFSNSLDWGEGRSGA